MTLRLVYDRDTEAILALIADLRERVEKLSHMKPGPRVPSELVGFEVTEDVE